MGVRLPPSQPYALLASRFWPVRLAVQDAALSRRRSPVRIRYGLPNFSFGEPFFWFAKFLFQQLVSKRSSRPLSMRSFAFSVQGCCPPTQITKNDNVYQNRRQLAARSTILLLRRAMSTLIIENNEQMSLNRFAGAHGSNEDGTHSRYCMCGPECLTFWPHRADQGSVAAGSTLPGDVTDIAGTRRDRVWPRAALGSSRIPGQ